MSTLPVKWVPPLMLLQNKITKTPMSGRPIETIPVIRLSDLDALREGLEAIKDQTSEAFIRTQAQRLLAMLPPMEGV